MTANLFIEKVAAMRYAQRDYFKTRDKEALILSKKLEKEVDALLAAIITPKKSII